MEGESLSVHAGEQPAFFREEAGEIEEVGFAGQGGEEGDGFFTSPAEPVEQVTTDGGGLGALRGGVRARGAELPAEFVFREMAGTGTCHLQGAGVAGRLSG